MNFTWIAIAVAAASLGWLFWRHLITPWYPPLEGMNKLVFVIACWYGGLMAAWASFNVRYWLPWVPVGCSLLALGTRVAWEPIQRWRRDRVIFRPAPAPRPIPWQEPERRKDQAA